MAAKIFFYRQDRKQELQFEELSKLEEQDSDKISYDGKGSTASSLLLIDRYLIQRKGYKTCIIDNQVLLKEKYVQVY